MEFVTDRTGTDLALGNEKGSYGSRDLNRVEAAVEQLSAVLRELQEPVPVLETKTDWHFSPLFSPEEWPSSQQMTRYLGNVRTILTVYGMIPELPESMEGLTLEGANQIERQLACLEQYIENQKAAWQHCGAAECGG